MRLTCIWPGRKSLVGAYIWQDSEILVGDYIWPDVMGRQVVSIVIYAYNKTISGPEVQGVVARPSNNCSVGLKIISNHAIQVTWWSSPMS
jgi:hypothetical protein